jgi:hypothetical protein
VPLADPTGPGALTQALNTGAYAGVSFTSVFFDGGAEVGFDALGRPLNHTEAPLAADGTIALSGASTVTVHALTGLITGP